jgi:NAD(P)-dependent dehydrogenase (short-subunit alcohol dehydrogenase family)
MDLGIRGRVALVGASGRGLGLATAHRLAMEGVNVAICDKDEGVLEPARAHVQGADHTVRVAAFPVDLTDAAAIEALVQRVKATLGPVDILITNSGGPPPGVFEDADDARWELAYRLTFLSAVRMIRAVLPDMKQRRWGRIINTVSEVALDPRFPGGGAYAAAKAALWAFTLSAAREAEPHGVTVNAISPGAATRMSRAVLGEDRGAVFRGGASGDLDLDPAHVARLVAYLSSAGAADVNGRILHVAAGQIREYSTQRSGRSELARRIAAILSAPAATG